MYPPPCARANLQVRAELKKAETRRLFCRTSGTGFIEQLDSPRGVSAAPPPGSAPASPRGATPRGGGGGGGPGGGAGAGAGAGGAAVSFGAARPRTSAPQPQPPTTPRTPRAATPRASADAVRGAPPTPRAHAAMQAHAALQAQRQQQQLLQQQQRRQQRPHTAAAPSLGGSLSGGFASSAPADALSAREGVSYAYARDEGDIWAREVAISREPAIARARTPRALNGLRVPAMHHAGGCTLHGATWAGGRGGGEGWFGATAPDEAAGAAAAAAAATQAVAASETASETAAAGEVAAAVTFEPPASTVTRGGAQGGSGASAVGGSP